MCQSVQPAVSGHKYLLKYKSILQHFYPQVKTFSACSPLRCQRTPCAAHSCVRKRTVLYVACCTGDLSPVQEELRPVYFVLRVPSARFVQRSHFGLDRVAAAQAWLRALLAAVRVVCVDASSALCVRRVQYVRDDAPHTDASAISAEEAEAAIAASAKKSTAKPEQDKKASVASVRAQHTHKSPRTRVRAHSHTHSRAQSHSHARTHSHSHTRASPQPRTHELARCARRHMLGTLCDAGGTGGG